MRWISQILKKIASIFKPKDYTEQLKLSMKNLLDDSPLVSQWKEELALKGITFEVVVATLEGDVEARTHLELDSNPWIEVDVSKVLKSRDRLEPVIGHEIGHIHDAYLKLGVEEFIATVRRETELPWDQRTVEKLAIEREDSLRQSLLTNYPQEYAGMQATRERQNLLSVRFNKF